MRLSPDSIAPTAGSVRRWPRQVVGAAVKVE